MIDRAKRVTLKRIGSVAIAVSAAHASFQAFATNTDKPTLSIDGILDAEIAEIDVHTRVSATSNDIEVVIVNRGIESTRITQMTPSQTITKRGFFDFSALLEDGDLTLAPGQVVTVPMTAHAVVPDSSSSVGQRADSLTSALRKSFSVITENESFARVTVADQVRFA